MKKIFLISICFLALTQVKAQEISKNAIGLRIGDDNAFGSEITYQRALKENNRLEFNLGIKSGNNFSGYKIAGIYQWVWSIENQFNWYAGAGGGLGTYKSNANTVFDVKRESQSSSYLFASGNIGVEYNFDIPLIISLDVRPELSSRKFFFRELFGFDVGISARYQF